MTVDIFSVEFLSANGDNL